MKILVVDDDPHLLDVVTIGFRLQWPDSDVLQARDGASALRAVREQHPDFVLLDVVLPDRDGFAVLAEIRRHSSVPVILLTARGEETDQVRGLELGADEYVVKPFSLLALIARAKALLRRADSAPSSAHANADILAGELVIDFPGHVVTRQGQPVELSPLEFRLLHSLVANSGQVVPYHVLLARVWGEDYDVPLDYLKVYISRLRAKLESGDGPRYIQTVRGFGYKFVRPAT